jgi:hypothetical protein
LLKSLIWGVSAVTFGTVALLLIIVAGFASLVPSFPSALSTPPKLFGMNDFE